MMGGLEHIIAEILEDAKQEADRILREADAQAEELIAQGMKEAEKQSAKAQQMIVEETDKRLKMEAASDRQKRRQALLKVRMEEINGVLEKAKDTICNLADAAYFDLLYKLFENHAAEDDGVISFSQKDLSRLPENFIERLNGALKKGSVKLDEKASDIASGFIIRYGKIEQNCSIDSIFEEKKSILEDRVNQCFEDALKGVRA